MKHQVGATTLVITTLGIMTHSTIMKNATLSINDITINVTQHNVTQHSVITPFNINLTKLFYRSLTLQRNKLQCLYLTILFSLV
jgi:hypothetical protein